MPATRGHLYLPYGEDSSIQVDYVHSGQDANRTTVLVPFAVDDAWRARIEEAVRANHPERTDIQISNAATGEVRYVGRQPTESTPPRNRIRWCTPPRSRTTTAPGTSSATI